MSDAQIANIKEVGTVLVRGGIPKDVRLVFIFLGPWLNLASHQEALAWKAGIRAYASLNKDQVKGTPLLTTGVTLSYLT